MSASSGFRRGDRVQLSPHALTIGLNPRAPRSRRGTIIGFARHEPCLWVRWDGLKTSYAYAASFIASANG